MLRPAPGSRHAAFATYTWGWIGTGYGVFVVAGGWDRFPRSYYAIDGLPAAPYWFGGLWIAAGLLVLAGQRYAHLLLRNGGLWALTVLCLASAGMVIYAAILIPDAGVGGAVLFAGIALQIRVVALLGPRRVRS